MKNLFLVVVAMFMAAGCVTGSVNSDGTMSSSAFGTSLGELANVRDRTVRTTVYERNADADAEAERELRRSRAAAENRGIEAQAQILEAWAGRINPADGSRLKELLARQERLFTAWEAETGLSDESLELKLSLWDEIQETRQLVSDFLNQQGAPAGYTGGMGGLPLMMPGAIDGGSSVSSATTNHPGFGGFKNITDRGRIRGFMGTENMYVGEADPGQTIPTIATPDVPTPYRLELYEGGGLIGIYTGTVTPDPLHPSSDRPYKWTIEVPRGMFRGP